MPFSFSAFLHSIQSSSSELPVLPAALQNLKIIYSAILQFALWHIEVCSSNSSDEDVTFCISAILGPHVGAFEASQNVLSKHLTNKQAPIAPIASIMPGTGKYVLPKMIVLDLDKTVWTQFTGRGTPKANEDIHLYEGAREIFASLAERRELWSGIYFAVASKNTTWAEKLMKKFRINHLFDFAILSGGSKVNHIQTLRERSGVSFNEMLFFDDQYDGNCSNVSKLGVLSVHCPAGIYDLGVFTDALRLFTSWDRSGRPKRTVVHEDGRMRQTLAPTSFRPKGKIPDADSGLMNEFIDVGFELLQFKRKEWNTTSARRWKASFGCSPTCCAIVWQMMDPPNNSFIPNNCHPKHLLWALMHMKLYTSQDALSSAVGGVSAKTVRKWVRAFIRELSQLSQTLVSVAMFGP